MSILTVPTLDEMTLTLCTKDHWAVHFEDGRTEKLFYHVNDAKEGIWMWESGRIDEPSRSIGVLLESAKLK